MESKNKMETVEHVATLANGVMSQVLTVKLRMVCYMGWRETLRDCCICGAIKSSLAKTLDLNKELRLE